MRMTATLDHQARQLTTTGKLRLKLKDKVLLRMALYQYQYMDKVPLYALADETMKIAKKECHPHSQRFLNAALRQLESAVLTLPEDLSSRYSFPEYFVQELQKDYGDQTEVILDQLNQPPSVVARKTGTLPPTFVAVDHPKLVSESPNLYIQNPSPANLLFSLLKDSQATRVLDLCAAPGGKTLLARDLFPKAELWANDLAQAKRVKMEENFHRLGLDCTITHQAGESYQSDHLFDLIIVDAPCTNTGVLHKRPEARWRLSPESTSQLVDLQVALLSHAASLLSPNGKIAYLTCSILKSENEGVVQLLEEKKMVRCVTQRTILPEKDLDGGFGALLELI
jgi:16S rRNA (cytosine967-C5)-methyltransferase